MAFDPGVERDLARHLAAAHPLRGVESCSLRDLFGPESEARAGDVLMRIMMRYRAGARQEMKGQWQRYEALWAWHRLRLWEFDGLTQEQAVVSQFGISRGAFYNAVRSVEALRIRMRIDPRIIVQAAHRTVWYALADMVLAGRMRRPEVVDWLQAEGPARELVNAIRGRDTTPGAVYAERVVHQASGAREAMRQNGVHVVQSGLDELDKSAIISGYDVVDEDDVVILRPRVYVYVCPHCGQEVDPKRLIAQVSWG